LKLVAWKIARHPKRAAVIRRALANVVDGPDHPHTDTASIALKGIIWAVSLARLIVTLTSHYNEQSAGESRSRN
jgi:hypothetical protein